MSEVISGPPTARGGGAEVGPEKSAADSAADSAAIDQILRDSRTIAVVGLSQKPDRPSYKVAKYLQDHGYRIVPVNPALTEVLDEPSYPDLVSIPGPVDVVDIFRRPEDVPPIVESAIAKGAKVVWMQEGIANEQAAETARAAGLMVVMNLCMKKEHEKRAGDLSHPPAPSLPL